MNTTIERVSQLESWLVNAGICPDCGSEIHHHEDEPEAACQGCVRGFGEWTGALPTIQILRNALRVAHAEFERRDGCGTSPEEVEAALTHNPPTKGGCYNDEQRTSCIAACNGPELPIAYITEADSVFCDECWHDREHDIGDRDPNGWLFDKQPWHPAHECASCGSRDGRFNEQ